ncbi:MAG: hypothetical protein ACYDCG_07610 [Candidatus Acidiferrales bacterium]
MKRNKASLFAALAAVLALTSCSGLPKGAGGGGGGGGTGMGDLTLTLHATPLTPPAGINILSFDVHITGISLTPTSGQTVVVNSSFGGSIIPVDFARAQSSSVFLANGASVTAQAYTGITIGFSAPTITYCTQPNPGVQGCAAGTVKTFSGNLSTPTVPITLTVPANSKLGLAINLNTTNALTIVNQAVTAINLIPTAFTTKTLPPAASSLAATRLDFFDNILGLVTAVSGQSVTVLTASGANFTATGSASTFFSQSCVLNNNNGQPCAPKVNQFASIDTAINSDGTLALLEYDPISALQIVWLEGVVTSIPSSNTKFQIVVTDQSPSTTGGSTTLYTGSVVNVTLVGRGGGAGSPFPFFIDTKGYPIPTNTFANATDTSAILPGMTVGLHVIGFTAPSGNTAGSMTSDTVVLRFTPIPGIVSSVAPPNTFSIRSVPPFFGLNGNSVVQLGNGNPATFFDGVTDPSTLIVGHTVAINGLYFGPNTATPFVAAKVRAF